MIWIGLCILPKRKLTAKQSTWPTTTIRYSTKVPRFHVKEDMKMRQHRVLSRKIVGYEKALMPYGRRKVDEQSRERWVSERRKPVIGLAPGSKKLWIVFHCGRDAFETTKQSFFLHIRKVRSAVRVSVIQTFLASLLSLPCRFDTRFKLLVRIPPASLEPPKSVLQSRMLLRLCLLHTESFLCLNSLNDQKCSRGAFIITICAMWWFLSFSWLGNC